MQRAKLRCSRIAWRIRIPRPCFACTHGPVELSGIGVGISISTGGRRGVGRSSCTHEARWPPASESGTSQGRNVRPVLRLTPAWPVVGDLDLRGSCRAGVASSSSPSSRSRVPSSSYLGRTPASLPRPSIRFISLHLLPTVHPIRYLLHRDSVATSEIAPGY